MPFRRLWLRENNDRLAAQLRNFGAGPPPNGAWELLGLLQDGRPECFLPLGAVLEHMFFRDAVCTGTYSIVF